MNRIAMGVSLVLGAMVGCAHSEAPPPNAAASAPENVTVTTTSAPPPQPANAARSDQQLNLSAEIRTKCGIDDSDRAPKFDFDSSQLAGNDRDLLQQVARCFTTGPLKGRSIQLVGRADPRGESEYNMNLGEARATSARTYLAALGVDNSRMVETSRGALDATGHDEDTWRRDRRVDVSLVP